MRETCSSETSSAGTPSTEGVPNRKLKKYTKRFAKKPERTMTSSKLSKFKTSMCHRFANSASCRFGDLCDFAHSRSELRRDLSQHWYAPEQCSKPECSMDSCEFAHNLNELAYHPSVYKTIMCKSPSSCTLSGCCPNAHTPEELRRPTSSSKSVQSSQSQSTKSPSQSKSVKPSSEAQPGKSSSQTQSTKSQSQSQSTKPQSQSQSIKVSSQTESMKSSSQSQSSKKSQSQSQPVKSQSVQSAASPSHSDKLTSSSPSQSEKLSSEAQSAEPKSSQSVKPASQSAASSSQSVNEMTYQHHQPMGLHAEPESCGVPMHPHAHSQQTQDPHMDVEFTNMVQHMKVQMLDVVDHLCSLYYQRSASATAYEHSHLSALLQDSYRAIHEQNAYSGHLNTQIRRTLKALKESNGQCRQLEELVGFYKGERLERLSVSALHELEILNKVAALKIQDAKQLLEGERGEGDAVGRNGNGGKRLVHSLNERGAKAAAAVERLSHTTRQLESEISSNPHIIPE